jgi:cell division inhibitor SepF
MASMWRKAMLYLGLGPDEDYDDYEVLGGNAPPPPVREPVRRAVMPSAHDPDTGSVRTLGAAPGGDPDAASRGHGHGPMHRERPPGANPAGNGHAPRRELADRPAGGPPRARAPVVRPLPVAAAKPHVVAPASFTDAQQIADEFKRTVPVIVNLQGVERDLMRRIIDFSSGLCYGLGGQMERVANHVYLLTPSDVEVSPEERRRWRDRGDS